MSETLDTVSAAINRYEDLVEFFGGDVAVLHNRKDFKEWLERNRRNNERNNELYDLLKKNGINPDNIVLPAKKLKAGKIVKLFNIAWYVLDPYFDKSDGPGIFLITCDPVFDMAFDNGKGNNWGISPLRDYLNEDWYDRLEQHGDVKNLMAFARELDTDNGRGDYGTVSDVVSILTCNEVRRYNKSVGLLPNAKGTPIWTATASGYWEDETDLVRCYSNYDKSLLDVHSDEEAGVCPCICIRPETEVVILKDDIEGGVQ